MRFDRSSVGGASTALLVAGFLTVWPHAAGATSTEQETLTVLDVPFLPQSEQLCGGAAAAMVLRYWGERQIHAEDFASSVEGGESGIRGDVLADTIRARGWIAHSFRGNNSNVQDHVARGRPLIALIEDQPGRYHYVVLLAWFDGHVILHDPARAPFRVVSESAFSTAWAATDFWTLLILPLTNASSVPSKGPTVLRTVAATAPALPAAGCDALVGEGVRLMQMGDQISADAALSTALARCPASALAARELAGLRFVQSRWHEAADLADRAAARAPEDGHTWRLLASSRFMKEDVDGALRAWNRIGEPRIDLVRVEGLEHTGYAIVEDLLSLAPHTELTVTALRRARRRLAMLPVASASRVGYRPVPGGLAEIDVAVVERRQFPNRMSLATVAAHSLIERELVLDIPAPTGSGARWIASWRWWKSRPRLGLSLLVPVAFGRSGLWRLDGFWERQSYAIDQTNDEGLAQEDRKRLALSYTDWIMADTRVALGVAFDRWNHARDYVGLFGSVEHRLAKDRLAARLQGAMWPALGSATSFGTAGVGLAWRSTMTSTSTGPILLTARAGFEAAGAQAPFNVWPGADVGHARDVLLRAHPLLSEGVVDGGILGRTLAHGGVELERTFREWPARLSLAVFGDVARAGHGLAPRVGNAHNETRTQIDIGFGLRLRVAGEARTLRIDVAQGLRDGRRAISAGWQLPWPEDH